MPSESTCPPEKFERIRLRQKKEVTAVALCFFSVPLVALLMDGVPIHNEPNWMFLGSGVLGLGAMLVGASALLALRKGRSAAWGLFGLGGYLGFAFLWFLPTICAHCGWTERAHHPYCRECGAPW